MSAKNVPVTPVTEEARRARVLAHVDRAKRIASMLDRWAAEDVGDEPEWDVVGIEPASLRTPRP